MASAKEETRRYITNSNSEKGKTLPKVTLQGRTIARNGKELSSYYCEYFCHRTLKLDATHELNIEINEPNGGSYEEPNAAVLKNIETVGEEKRTRSKISKKNGVMQEYAVLENGETFHVSRDGSWKYLSNDTRIVYLKKLNHHVFSITGAESSITNANPAETMSRVKERISKLMDFVK